MNSARVTKVEARSDGFAAHHKAALPQPGDVLAFAGQTNVGAFGSIHPLSSVNGAATGKPLLVKLFDATQLSANGGTKVVASRLSELFDALKQAGGAWPDAVLALPYVVCTVELNGATRLLALMLDLGKRGYVTPPFTNDDERRAYLKNTPVHDRVLLAHSLALRAALFERIGFLHGDLNPENLLCHPGSKDVQVIDFDSGVMVKTGSERPLTCGKPDDCLPPEVKVPNDPKFPKCVDQSRYTAGAERWSWMSLFGFFLLAQHPAFILSQISSASIDAYAKAPERWPDIDRSSRFYTTSQVNRRIHERYVKQLPMPNEVRELFADAFDAGLAGDARPDARKWVGGLANLQKPPHIADLSMSDTFAIEGDELTVTWKAENATHIELVPGGRQPAQGSLKITVAKTMKVELTAHNAFGQTSRTGPVVYVSQPPQLPAIALPLIPDLPDLATAPELTAIFGGPNAFTLPDLRLLGPDHRAPGGNGPVRLPPLPAFPTLDVADPWSVSWVKVSHRR